MRVRTRRAREAASWPYLSACRCWLVDDRTSPVEGLHFHYPAAAQKCRVVLDVYPQFCAVTLLWMATCVIHRPGIRDVCRVPDCQGSTMGEFQQPFRGSEALRDGQLTRHGLRTYRRLHRDVYVHRSAELTALSRARAAWLWADGEAVLAGFSAAAVHGTRWIGVGESATLIRRGSRRSVDGIEVRADALLPDEVCRVGEMLVTTPARQPSTWADGCPLIAPSRSSTPSATTPDCARRRFPRWPDGIGANVDSRRCVTSCRSWIPVPNPHRRHALASS